ncbi:PQQ-binding-like beta-propeller repeat protein [bacterium]|nr:PQQ-binding-like beta-propeller repeat protein [bacterium]
MERPSYEESIRVIRERGVDVARGFLRERGMTFREPRDEREIEKIRDDIERLKAEEDNVGAASCLMQCHKIMEQHPVGSEAPLLCREVYGIVNQQYSDDQYSESALRHFQLAAALNPRDNYALGNVLDVCFYGEERRMDVALHYMVVRAHIGGGDEVDYVLKQIQESELRISEPATPEIQKEGPAAEPIYTMAGGNMQRTGSVATNLVPPLELVWTFKAGWVAGSPVIAGSILVIGDKQGMIHGLDWKNGQKKWERKLNAEVYGTPAILGSRVFLGDSTHALCLDLHTGEEIWSTMAREKKGLEASFSMMGCILCFKDRVLFADSEIALYDADTGRLVHSERTASDPDTHLGACSDGSYVYFPSGRSIVRLDPTVGKVQSVFGAAEGFFTGKIIAGPMIAENLIVYGTNISTIEARSLSNLKPLWSFQAEGSREFVQCRPAYANGRLFFGSAEGDFYAVDKNTGKMIWKQKLAGPVESSPLVCGNVVYIPANGFFALDVADGKILWKEEFKMQISCSPAVADDLVFFGFNQLYAYRGKIISAATPSSPGKPWWKIW